MEEWTNAVSTLPWAAAQAAGENRKRIAVSMTATNGVASPLKEGAKWALRKTLYRRAIFHPKSSERPFLIRLDINNACNLACKQCFYVEYRKTGVATRNLSLGEFERLADRLFPYTYALQLACGFESTINPDFAPIVRLIDRYGIRDVGMVTNATLLDGERAQAVAESDSISTLAVSIDGITPETYEKIRGRPLLDKVLENVAGFQDLRRRLGKTRPYIQINTVIMRSNLSELPALTAWAVERGVDGVLFGHVEPFEKANEESVLHVPEEYNRVRDKVRETAAGSRLCLIVPPPLTPECFDAQTGRYRWSCLEEAARNAAARSVAGLSDPSDSCADLANPYPADVHCICPWMTLVVDAWGNLWPCGPRRGTAPLGNILAQPLEKAVNTLGFLKLRRAMLQRRHAQACGFCKPVHPYADPMKSRLVRFLPEGH